MSCYYPLIGKYLPGINVNTGRQDVIVISGRYSPDLKNAFPIPCGKCIGCRLDYSRQWADRCMLEAQYHKHNIFLTLTYDNEHLPPCRDGSPVHSLRKRDLQLFMKRLRKKFGDQTIRFYACGEYGSSAKSFRPHYHLILFGLELPDLKLLNKKNGFLYYTSDTISNLWPYGFHIASDVSWDTCAYVARYVMKKQKGKGKEIYEELNFEPEFTLMSRRPGIGKQYYDDHNDIVVNDTYIPTKDGSKRIRSNRYFDKLFDIEYPNTLEFIKEDRKISALQREWLLDSQSSMDFLERNEAAALVKSSQIKALKRKEV